MTMTLSSYWSSLLSWFTSNTGTGTNTRASNSSKGRQSVQPPICDDQKETLASALTLQHPDSGSRSDLDFECCEYEMYDVGTSSGVSRNVGTDNSRARDRSNAQHGRSQSESAYSNSRPRPDSQRAERAYNTLPRSRNQKPHTHTAHSRASSYTPVVVVPGVVNSSFLLFSPEVKGTGTVQRRRRAQPMQPIATKSELEKREEEREWERREFDGETSEEGTSSGSGSPRSRSSFDSFGTSDTQSSYTSDGAHSTMSSPDGEQACSLSHRAPYTISDR